MSDFPYSRPCTKCHLVKPLGEFSNATRGKYGRKASCKACDAARHAAQFVPKPVDEEARRARYTRGREGSKLCRKCGVAKDRSEFGKSRDGKYGPRLRSYCNGCAPAEKRRRSLKELYGITVAEYDAMLESQGGVCAICKRTERAARDNKVMLMSVDHCHRTGRIRGILCHACNRALGLLGDEPGRIRDVIRYLHGLPPGAAPGTQPPAP